jgi:hypothetical protein
LTDVEQVRGLAAASRSPRAVLDAEDGGGRANVAARAVPYPGGVGQGGGFAVGEAQYAGTAPWPVKQTQQRAQHKPGRLALLRAQRVWWQRGCMLAGAVLWLAGCGVAFTVAVLNGEPMPRVTHSCRCRPTW